MKVELNLIGDTVSLNLNHEEVESLYSFLEFHTRTKTTSVSPDEYKVVDEIKDELLYFVGE